MSVAGQQGGSGWKITPNWGGFSGGYRGRMQPEVPGTEALPQQETELRQSEQLLSVSLGRHASKELNGPGTPMSRARAEPWK